MADDALLQSEEVDALSSIYGDDVHVYPNKSTFEIMIQSHDSETFPTGPSSPKIQLRVHFPDDYPSKSPPVAEVEAPWLNPYVRKRIWEGLQELANESLGEVLVFKWVEWIKEQEWIWQESQQWIKDQISNESTENSLKENNIEISTKKEEKVNSKILSQSKTTEIDFESLHCIIHGEPFTERKSTFQAHLAPVNSLDSVNSVMTVILSNRKIKSATHNIMAYRISSPHNSSIIQDFDDDGETAAGGRLLHLLQILNVKNVVVVVSRWFGGVLLGPERFKHINNAARQLLDSSGYIESGQSGKNSKR